MIIEGAVAHYIDYYSVLLDSLQVQLDSEKVLLEKNIELLNNTPKTINQKEAMNEALNTDNSINIIVMGNIINPNYTELELDIINIKQSINYIENTMSKYRLFIGELEAKQSEVERYYKTGEFDEFNSNFIRATRSNLYLASQPVAPSRKTSPNNTLNVIVGILIGGVIAVLFAIIKDIWFTKK